VSHALVLYDGVCGLCNRLVRSIIKRDREGIFVFASLQSGLAKGILEAHAENPSQFDTIYVVADFDPARSDAARTTPLLARSDAARFVVRELGGIWRAAARALDLLPRAIRDWMYGVVARNRYLIFGRYEACPLPSEELRRRFLDV